MVVHTYNPSTWEVKKNQEFEVIIGPVLNPRPGWLYENSSQKLKIFKSTCYFRHETGNPAGGAMVRPPTLVS